MAKKRTALLETETPEKKAEVIPKEIEKKVEAKGDVALYKAEIKRLETMIREKDKIISNLQAANEQISDELSKARNK